MRRMSTFMGKDTTQMLQNVEAGYKIDEPVYLIVLNSDNEWIIEKNIKLRESKKQQGLVSFDLNKEWFYKLKIDSCVSILQFLTQ